jgi:phosphoglycerate dehydrogenase-like enzyme
MSTKAPQAQRILAMSHQDSPMLLAILDDYQGVATKIFGRLSPAIEISAFPDTLDPRRNDERATLIERLRPFHIISTMRERTPLPPDVIEALPNLRLILTTGIFNASIAITTCKERGVLVIGTSGKRLVDRDTAPNAPSLSYTSTAQHTWALILALVRLVPQSHNSIMHGKWQTGFATSLAGNTLGILGFGRLGQMVARTAVLGFDMKVIAWSSSLTDADVTTKAEQMGLPAGSISRSQCKEDFFRSADVLSVHYVLSDRSRGIIGETELACMKPTSILINTSRGPLIDEEALFQCLKAGKIRGAALDVFDREPLPANSEWRTYSWGKNGSSQVVLTPHMGYVETNTIHAWYEESAVSLRQWLKGETPAVVLT